MHIIIIQITQYHLTLKQEEKIGRNEMRGIFEKVFIQS